MHLSVIPALILLSVAAPPEGVLDRARLLEFRDELGKVQPVRSVADWKRRRAEVLAGMQAVMGKLPPRDDLAPLDIRETGREEGRGYTRITLTYAAHRRGEKPDRVPAHLYLPTGLDAKTPRPGILALHQTSPQGKENVGSKSTHPRLAYADELARRGYVVIAPDYPSFGDYKYDFAADDYESGTMKGNFNHLRAVDLLCERKEIDRERLGVIGHSLGGHNALFVAAFDERLKVVVTSCGWTPFRDYYGGKLDGWTSDRYMPRIGTQFGNDPRRVPFDFDELIAALAPRAVYSHSPLRDDNFAVAGVKAAVANAAGVYRLYEAQDRLVATHPDCGHDFPDDARRAAYGFIDRHLRHKPTSESIP